MKLTLTNIGTEDLPVWSKDEGGWAEVAQPGKPLELSKAGSDVILIGDKPDVIDTFKQGLKVITSAAKALLTSIAGRKDKGLPALQDDTIRMTIANNGENSVHVIPGDVDKETDLAAGESLDLEGKGYIELRELLG